MPDAEPVVLLGAPAAGDADVSGCGRLRGCGGFHDRGRCDIPGLPVMKQENRTDLMVFIDLAFILLVGFLILTDTAPREIVALPGEAEDQPAQGDTPEVFQVHFDENLRFVVESGQQIACQPNDLAQLTACMTRLEAARRCLCWCPGGLLRYSTWSRCWICAAAIRGAAR